MPYQLDVPLTSQNGNSAPDDNVLRPWHSMFYSWLSAGDEALAKTVHDEMEPKPFTIGPVKSNGDHTIALPVTLLKDAIWPALQQGIARTATCEVHGQPYTVGKDVNASNRTYETLWEQAKCDTSIVLQFLSPTSFRSQGNHYPLPDPFMVFQSYLLRWNHFVPESMQININLLDVVMAHVVIAKYRLETHAVDFGGYKQVGFVGWVRFGIKQSEMIGGEMVKRLNVLADFANYCGTGHKTTQGMGQTRRVVG